MEAKNTLWHANAHAIAQLEVIPKLYPLWLKQQRRWIPWRLRPHEEDKTRVTKPPACGTKSTDKSTWLSLAEAAAKAKDLQPDAEAHRLKPQTLIKGVGFCTLDVEHFTGIDIDHCITPDGSLSPMAREIVDTLNTYTEISPSGDGLRLFIGGCGIDKDFIDKASGLEVYSGSGGRYLTCTGDIFEGRGDLRGEAALYAGTTDQAAQAALTAMVNKYHPQPKKREPQREHRSDSQSDKETQQEILSALDFLPCYKLSYAEWLSVGMACKLEGLPLSVWDSWSQNDSRYNDGECAKKWESFRRDSGYDRKTIFYLAQREGWENPRKHKDGEYDPNEWDAGGSDNIPWNGELPAEDAADPTAQDAAETPSTDKPAADAAASVDYSAYYEACRARLDLQEVASFLAEYNLPTDVITRYGIGYDPAAADGAPRLIVPVNEKAYFSVRTDGVKANEETSAGSPIAWNAAAMYADGIKHVFITNGVLNALAICASDYEAVSVKVSKEFTQRLRRQPTAATLLVDSNAKGAAKFVNDLRAAGAKAFTVDICCGLASPAAAQAENYLTVNFDTALETATSEKPGNIAAYMQTGMLIDIAKFKDAIPTGFTNLDKRSGGLFAGTYFLAAISSLGKTTFAHQMADQIAAAGNDVLFFSLEQSTLELASKSITREIALANPESEITSVDIRRGYYPAERDAAVKRYVEKVGDRLTIYSGLFEINVDFIKSKVADHIARADSKPVVFVDYLQILEPLVADAESKRGIQLREIIDHNVKALEIFAKNEGLVIFCIASVNRANYLTPIDFEAIKESGGIEYSADAVYGLQLQCVRDEIFQNEEKGKVKKREALQFHKQRKPRLIELVSLKNRNCNPAFRCYFEYFPAQERFAIDTLMEDGSRQDKAQRKAALDKEFEKWKKDQNPDATPELDFDEEINQDEAPKWAKKRKGKAEQPKEEPVRIPDQTGKGMDMLCPRQDLAKGFLSMDYTPSMARQLLAGYGYQQGDIDRIAAQMIDLATTQDSVFD